MRDVGDQLAPVLLHLQLAVDACLQADPHLFECADDIGHFVLPFGFHLELEIALRDVPNAGTELPQGLEDAPRNQEGQQQDDEAQGKEGHPRDNAEVFPRHFSDRAHVHDQVQMPELSAVKQPVQDGVRGVVDHDVVRAVVLHSAAAVHLAHAGTLRDFGEDLGRVRAGRGIQKLPCLIHRQEGSLEGAECFIQHLQGRGLQGNPPDSR